MKEKLEFTLYRKVLSYCLNCSMKTLRNWS